MGRATVAVATGEIPPALVYPQGRIKLEFAGRMRPMTGSAFIVPGGMNLRNASG
jgi:hypothetical protein